MGQLAAAMVAAVMEAVERVVEETVEAATAEAGAGRLLGDMAVALAAGVWVGGRGVALVAAVLAAVEMVDAAAVAFEGAAAEGVAVPWVTVAMWVAMRAGATAVEGTTGRVGGWAASWVVALTVVVSKADVLGVARRGAVAEANLGVVARAAGAAMGVKRGAAVVAVPAVAWVPGWVETAEEKGEETAVAVMAVVEMAAAAKVVAMAVVAMEVVAKEVATAGVAAQVVAGAVAMAMALMEVELVVATVAAVEWQGTVSGVANRVEKGEMGVE